MSAPARVLGGYAGLERSDYDGAYGLLIVGVLLLSTLDETTIAPVGRGLALLGFACLPIVNVGAALGVYIAAALLFSEHHFAGQGSWVERPDNYALMFLVLYLVLGRSFSRSAGTFGWTSIVVALLLATTFIHLVALVGFNAYELTRFLRMFGVPLGMFVLLRRAALSPRELRALLLIVAVVGVYLALVSLLEVGGWYRLIIPPWLGDPEFNPAFGSDRVGGLPMQPEWNALVIGLALCVILPRLDSKKGLATGGWLIGCGMCLLATYFTYTRGAWLGLLVAGVPYFWHASAARALTLRRRALFVAFTLGFAVLVLWFPSAMLQGRASDLGTVYFRFNVWVAGLRMAVDHPVLGVGFGQFIKYVPSYVQALESIPESVGLSSGTIAHNTFLSVAAELGLVGLVLYLWILGGVYKAAHLAAGTAWGQRGRVWVAGFTLVYLVNTQFITAHELTPNVMYFGLMGAVAGLGGSRRRE